MVLTAAVSAAGEQSSAAPQHAATVPRTDAWPKTCDEAVELLLKELNSEGKERIRNTPREELVKFHFGLGMRIRNEFGMWGGNTALVDSCISEKPGTRRHPDEASMIIIERVWERLGDAKQTAPPQVLEKSRHAGER